MAAKLRLLAVLALLLAAELALADETTSSPAPSPDYGSDSSPQLAPPEPQSPLSDLSPSSDSGVWISSPSPSPLESLEFGSSATSPSPSLITEPPQSDYSPPSPSPTLSPLADSPAPSPIVLSPLVDGWNAPVYAPDQNPPSPAPSDGESIGDDIGMDVDGDGVASTGMSGGRKAGITVAVVAAVGVIGFVGCVYKKRRDNTRRAQLAYSSSRDSFV